MRLAAVCLAACAWVAGPAKAQPSCLAEAQQLSQVSDEGRHTFLAEGESVSFAASSTRCVAAVAVAPLHARLRLTLFSGEGEALASSDERANSAYVLRCGYEGDAHVFVEMTRGAGEVRVAFGAVEGNRRQAWEARSGPCFSPPIGLPAPDNDVGPVRAVGVEELASARMEPWTRRGWEPVGVFHGSEIQVEAEGCVRLIALSDVALEVPRIRRRGSSLSFCLDGGGSFRVRMDSPGSVAVLRRDQFDAPVNVPSVLWSEARAQGSLRRLGRVHGAGGESWERTIDFDHGCHRVVAFGRGAVMSVEAAETRLRQRQVQGWSQVLFCGSGARRVKLRFLSAGSDVRLFAGDL